MNYPKLDKTPIKEIIFSISYEEIVDNDCFDKFIELDFIKKKFPDKKPSITSSIEIDNGIARISDKKNGFHLKNTTEVLQMRTGSLSYHYLNGYNDFSTMIDNLMLFWVAFDKVTKDHLTINSISVRYINEIEIDEDNPASRLIQVYPKQSSDRDIINFQNSVRFSYKGLSDYLVNVVSTKSNNDRLLLDITVTKKIDSNSLKEMGLKKSFEPLQEIKNKVFFDSITAKALIRYINQNK
jgi:uncharacterized protein (TIGR04255 family)